MAQDLETPHQNPPPAHLTIPFRWPTPRGMPLRRRKPGAIRLGGSKKHRRKHFFVKMLRRMKLKWLKLQYSRMLKKLREYYRGLVKDIMDAGATLETYQQRLLMETSFAVPVMGVSFSSYPSVAGSGRPRALIF